MPENLVFTVYKTRVLPIAPLLPPHPGCWAFYNKTDFNILAATNNEPHDPFEFRGYKVYRTTRELGVGLDDKEHAPHIYSTQPVFKNDRPDTNPKQKVNRTVELISSGAVGSLNIAFRALSKSELELLVLACTLNWRLGGGKPVSSCPGLLQTW